MTRVKRGTVARARRKKVLKAAKGYQGQRKRRSSMPKYNIARRSAPKPNAKPV